MRSRPVVAPFGWRWPLLLWAIGAALLAASTLAVFVLVAHHAPIGPEISALAATEPDDDPLSVWAREPGKGRITFTDGVLELEAPADAPYVLLRRPLPRVAAAIGWRIRAEIRLVDVVGGARAWERPRVHLTGRRLDGSALPDRREGILKVRPDAGWAQVEFDHLLPREADGADLVVRLQRTSGRLAVRALTVLPLGENPALVAARRGLAAAWIGLGLCGGLLLLRAAVRPALAGLAVLGGTVGLGLLLAPPDLIEGLLALVPGAAGRRFEAMATLGHVGLFAGLATVAGLSVGPTRTSVQLPLLILLAGIAEVVQIFGIEREISLADAIANGIGGLIGLTLARWVLALRTPAEAGEEELPRADIVTALALTPLGAAGEAARTLPESRPAQ